MLPFLSARDEFPIPAIRKERFVKKKWLIILSLAFVVILLLAFVATIPVFSDDPYTYFVTSSGQAVITGFDKTYRGNLSITRKLDGFPVTVIDYNAFKGCTRLTRVTIPNSVIIIDNQAFYGCTALTSVTIPDSVKIIGGCAFGGCTALTSFAVDTANPKYSSLDGLLFNKEQTTLILCPCGKNGTCTIPDGVTNIGFGAFAECTALVRVTLPDSVITIGDFAFCECTRLTSVTIPDSVITIGDLAFYECPRLTSVTIPDGVTNIGDFTFSGCTSLTKITVDAANPNYSSLDGVLFDKARTTLIQCPGGRNGTYTIPDSVTVIDRYAFYNCTALTSVTVGRCTTTVGFQAFNSCTALKNVTIPNSVKTISYGAFAGCTALTNILFAGNAPTLGDLVFSGTPNTLTLHYRPGTTGWGATYGGRPTKPWDSTDTP